MGLGFGNDPQPDAVTLTGHIADGVVNQLLRHILGFQLQGPDLALQLGTEGGGGVIFQKLTLVEQDDLVGDEFNIRHDMGGQNDDAVPGELGDQIAEADALSGVKARRGLVQNEDAGITEHGLGDAQPLAHTAGEGTDLLGGCIRQIHRFQQLPNALLAVLLGDAFQNAHIPHEFQHGEVPVKLGILGQIANAAQELCTHAPNVLPVDVNVAPITGNDTHKEIDERGLTGTVGAQQAVDAVFQSRRKLPEGVFGFVFLGETAKFQSFRINTSLSCEEKVVRNVVIVPTGSSIYRG